MPMTTTFDYIKRTVNYECQPNCSSCSMSNHICDFMSREFVPASEASSCEGIKSFNINY